MSVRYFETHFVYGLDLSTIISTESMFQLLSLRSKGSLFNHLASGLDQNLKHGTFTCEGPEEVVIKAQVERSLAMGGKNTFAPSFFDQYAPYWLREGKDRSFSKIIKKNPGSVLTASDLEIDSGDSKKALCIYKGCELRVFREGILSFRFSFSNVGQKLYIPVEQFVDLLRHIQRQAYLAFQERVMQLSTDWADPGHPVSNKTRLAFVKSDLSTFEASLRSVISEYRIVILDTLHTRNQRSWVAQPIENLDSQKILGLLNLAKWYQQYAESYSNGVLKNGLSYKTNELILCDGSSSLIMMPEYWVESRLQNFMSYLLLLTELINSQKSFIQAINGSIENEILGVGEGIRNRIDKRALQEVLLMKGLIHQLERAGDPDSLVSHGFTGKYLRMVSRELNIPERVQVANRKMAIVDSKLTIESEQRLASAGLSFDRIAVLVALAALLISLMCEITQVILEILTLLF